jgi:hypothetical protein
MLEQKFSIPYTFWEDVERPLEYILYSDTDSLFIVLDETPKTIREYGEIALSTGEEINKNLACYMQNILEKSNVSPDNNRTFFKTEMAVKDFLIIAKKMYYYIMAFEEKKSGHVYYEEGKPMMKGLSFMKSDTAEFIRECGKRCLKEIFKHRDENSPKLNTDILNMLNDVRSKYTIAIEEFNFKYIGKPQKNTANISVLKGSRLFNTIFETNAITKGQAVLKVPISINNTQRIRGISPTFLRESDFSTKFNFLSVPYNYSEFDFKTKLNEFQIKILNEFEVQQGERYPRVFRTTQTKNEKTAKKTQLYQIIEAANSFSR